VLITLLKHGHQLAPADASGSTPLHVASFNGADRCVHLLLQKIAEAEGGDDARVRMLSGANVFGATALCEAACNGHAAVSAELFSAQADWRPAPAADALRPAPQGARHRSRSPGAHSRSRSPGAAKGQEERHPGGRGGA